MSYLGVWPGVYGSTQWFSHLKFFLVIFLLLFFDIIPQTHMLFLVLDDFNMLMDILMTADIILTLACIKLITMWYRRAGNWILICNNWNVRWNCALFIITCYKSKLYSICKKRILTRIVWQSVFTHLLILNFLCNVTNFKIRNVETFSVIMSCRSK